MLSLRRVRKQRGLSGEPDTHKPRNIPENIYMWGGSFWDAWREQASPLAQQHLDQIVAQFKRSTRMSELRYHRRGSILTVEAGSRSLRLELIWENGQVIEVIDQSRSMKEQTRRFRTPSSC